MADKTPEPTKPCPVCNSTDWWWLDSEWGKGWECGKCHPEPKKQGVK